MNNMKKIIALLAVFGAMLSSLVIANAQDIEFATINDYLKNPETIGYSTKFNEEVAKMEKDGDGYIFPNGFRQVLNFGENNGTINCDMSFNFTDSQWVGLQLNAKDPDERCWTTTCYGILIWKDRVEIQVFGNASSKTGYLANFTYAVPQNEKINVKAGAIPMEEGNYVFVQIGDAAFGVHDRGGVHKEGGYFSIDGDTGGLTLYETEENNAMVPYVEVSYDEKEGALSAITGPDTYDNVSYEWYLSTDEFIYEEKSMVTDLAQFESVYGVTQSALELKGSEIGLYGMCIATIDGVKAYSNVAYADPVEYVKNHGYVGRVGYSKAVMNGVVFTYDEADKDIYPDIIDEVVYLPYRGIAESLGCPVEWNAETRVVRVLAPVGNGNDPEVTFCVDKQGFLNFKTLMNSQMSYAPKLINDRTFLDVYSTSNVFELKNVIVDETTEMVIMTADKIDLSAAQLEDLAYYMDEI